MTYSEAKFIEAEARIIINPADPLAQAALQEAVKGSFAKVVTNSKACTWVAMIHMVDTTLHTADISSLAVQALPAAHDHNSQIHTLVHQVDQGSHHSCHQTWQELPHRLLTDQVLASVIQERQASRTCFLQRQVQRRLQAALLTLFDQ